MKKYEIEGKTYRRCLQAERVLMFSSKSENTKILERFCPTGYKLVPIKFEWHLKMQQKTSEQPEIWHSLTENDNMSMEAGYQCGLQER